MAINRRWFFHVGSFDEGMLIWGGENLEISIRVWTCGGSVYIAPCSRVGHVFRRYLPYTFPTDLGGASIRTRNYQRLVDVWFDDYASYYYATVGARQSFTDTERASIAARKQLRHRLQCRPFSWYLNTVFPELVPPDKYSVHFGELKNLYTKSCVRVNETRTDKFLELTYCAWHDLTLTFSYTDSSTIVKHGCGRCLTALETGYAALEQCETGRVDQRWSFRHAEAGWKRYRSSDIDHMDYRELDSRPTSVAKLSAVTDKGRTVCLTQVSVFTPSGREQIAGLLDCVNSGDVSDLFQYWYYTYTLHWDT